MTVYDESYFIQSSARLLNRKIYLFLLTKRIHLTKWTPSFPFLAAKGLKSSHFITMFSLQRNQNINKRAHCIVVDRESLSYFALRDTFVTLWISCPPKHVMWQRVIRGTGEFKVRNLIQGTGWKIYLRWLPELALFIFATPRWWVSIRTKQLSAVAILLYRF